MATHSCIGSPCTICNPDIDPTVWISVHTQCSGYTNGCREGRAGALEEIATHFDQLAAGIEADAVIVEGTAAWRVMMNAARDNRAIAEKIRTWRASGTGDGQTST